MDDRRTTHAAGTTGARRQPDKDTSSGPGCATPTPCGRSPRTAAPQTRGAERAAFGRTQAPPSPDGGEECDQWARSAATKRRWAILGGDFRIGRKSASHFRRIYPCCAGRVRRAWRWASLRATPRRRCALGHERLDRFLQSIRGLAARWGGCRFGYEPRARACAASGAHCAAA